MTAPGWLVAWLLAFIAALACVRACSSRDGFNRVIRRFCGADGPLVRLDGVAGADVSESPKAPAAIVGAQAVTLLHGAGYRILPVVPTKAMCTAAGKVLPRREDGRVWISPPEKAKLRWTAMLNAYTQDLQGMRRYLRVDGAVEMASPKHRTWRMTLGRLKVVVRWKQVTP